MEINNLYKPKPTPLINNLVFVSSQYFKSHGYRNACCYSIYVPKSGHGSVILDELVNGDI